MAQPTEVGLVAGRGRYPLLFCEEARRHNVDRLVVVAMHGETDERIETLADEVRWVHVGQINKTIRTFTKIGIGDVVFAGQIKPGRLFGDLRPDWRAVKLLAALKLKNADSIFGAIAAEFEKDGLKVLPATTFLEDHLASVGVMGRVKPGRTERGDLEYGLGIAREISRLDIGQTVVVREGTVLAVEAFEGSDAAIRRGGEVGKGKVTVVKVAKPGHDLRFDVPCIGLRTVESLIAAGAAALGVQAGMTLFIDRPAVLDALDKARIATVGLEIPGD